MMAPKQKVPKWWHQKQFKIPYTLSTRFSVAKINTCLSSSNNDNSNNNNNNNNNNSDGNS